MSANPLRDVRWTLAQALVWVLSRDHALTEQVGKEQVDPLWIAVRCCTVPDAGPVSAWRELRGHIVAGSIYADGRPGDHSGPKGDRDPIKVVAPDLRLDGERHSLGRECFLSGDVAEQSCWYAVEMTAENVTACFPVGPSSIPTATDPGLSLSAKQTAVLGGVRELWPSGIPMGFSHKDRNARIEEHLLLQGVRVAPATIGRALRADRD